MSEAAGVEVVPGTVMPVAAAAYPEMRDAAYPSGLTGWTGPTGGYLPAPRADNPWTAADWWQFRANRKLPIWVAGMNGAEEAWACLQALQALGVPRGVPVAVDMETRVDRTYLTRFGNVLHWAGFKAWTYGSKDFVFENPPLDGYWVADYTGTSHMDDGSVATQWTDAGPYDRSAIASSTVSQLWL